MKTLLIHIFLVLMGLGLQAQTYLATHFDNDLLYIPANDDREYTFGLGLIAGWQQKSNQFVPDLWRFQSIKLGIELYTPDQLSAENIVRSDRPYASLIYLQSQWTRFRTKKGRLFQQKLTAGMMGLAWSGEVQDAAHALTRKVRQTDYPAAPMGWHHQISNGGELALAYEAQLQQRLGRRVLPKWIQVMAQGGGKIGYQSELNGGLHFRLGKNRSQIWQMASQPSTAFPLSGRSEWYFYGHGNLRLIGYNAFLQGQLKPNPYSLSHSQIRPLVVESELGLVYRRQGFQTGYGLHLRSREYHAAEQALFIWGVVYMGFQLGR